MSEEIRFGRIRENKRGEMGTNVHIHLHNEHGWSGRYRIATYGLDAAAVVAEIDRVREHHRKKALRLTGMAQLQDEEFTVDGDTFILTDVSIHDSAFSAGDVVLYVCVKKLLERKGGQRRDHRSEPVFKWRTSFASIDDIPTDEEIRVKVVNALMARAQKMATAMQTIAAAKDTLSE